jgi:hypothetical protein
MFDQLYLNVFKYYQPRLKQKAGNLAIFYISLVQIALLILLLEFFLVFSKQMNVSGLSDSKIIFLIIFGSVIIYFKNWMTYTGRKRNVLKSKLKKRSEHSVIILWLIPVALIFLCVMFWIKII